MCWAGFDSPVVVLSSPIGIIQGCDCSSLGCARVSLLVSLPRVSVLVSMSICTMALSWCVLEITSTLHDGEVGGLPGGFMLVI